MRKLTNFKPRLSSAPPRLKSPPKIVEQFYSSPEWRSLVARINRERRAYCQRCGSTDRIVAGQIFERKNGGADLDRTTSSSCATLITRRRRHRQEHRFRYRRGCQLFQLSVGLILFLASF